VATSSDRGLGEGADHPGVHHHPRKTSMTTPRQPARAAGGRPPRPAQRAPRAPSRGSPPPRLGLSLLRRRAAVDPVRQHYSRGEDPLARCPVKRRPRADKEWLSAQHHRVESESTLVNKPSVGDAGRAPYR
jgi:hypothetical protein